MATEELTKVEAELMLSFARNTMPLEVAGMTCRPRARVWDGQCKVLKLLLEKDMRGKLGPLWQAGASWVLADHQACSMTSHQRALKGDLR